MINRATKLRWRRRFRRSQRQVENLGVQAEEGLERHFFKRLERLVGVRRFVMTWILLLVLIVGGVILQLRALSGYYQRVVPSAGGTYTEGIVGAFTNANPIYATGPVDSAVARLVFSGLMKYDSTNHLVGDIAKNWIVNQAGTQYTVVLRNDVLWHDGYALTADDVVFTFQTIQNPDAKSPLLQDWKGITVTAQDKFTIVFTLPHALTAFPYSLTTGIIPKHILGQVPASQLRSLSFNALEPTGSGPFVWETVEVHGDTPEKREERVGLSANTRYYMGRPKLDRLIIRAFHDEKYMTESFADGQLTAMAGLETVPDTIKASYISQSYNIPLTGEVVIFLKTTNEILQDKGVRQALVRGTNTAKIITGLGYPVIPANEPLLKSQVGYASKFAQLTFNVHEANKLLNEAGWHMGAKNIRRKDGQPLRLQLFAQSNSQYAYVTQTLQRQWKKIGVDLQVTLEPEIDLRGPIEGHTYDILLYGISLGADPDVFAYWDSTQADIRSPNRLNFSEYSSATADRALESGRTRVDPGLRAIKYQPFLQAWRSDAPAITLYQPRFLYVTREQVYNFNPTIMNYATDRFSNIQDWMIREDKVNK